MKGPPVVFLPALGVAAEADFLAVATVAAVVDGMGAGPVRVVGQSMGGTVGIALAPARPYPVAALIIGAGNVTPGGGGHARRIAEHGLEDFRASGFPGVLGVIEEAARSGDRMQAVVAASWRQAGVTGLHGNARMLFGLPEGFLDRSLALDLPRGVRLRRAVTPRDARARNPGTPDPDVRAAAGATSKVTTGAGHVMPREPPIPSPRASRAMRPPSIDAPPPLCHG